MRREKKDQILAVLPEKIRGILLNHGLDFEKIQEIRLREEQPLGGKGRTFYPSGDKRRIA